MFQYLNRIEYIVFNHFKMLKLHHKFPLRTRLRLLLHQDYIKRFNKTHELHDFGILLWVGLWSTDSQAYVHYECEPHKFEIQ